MNFTVLGQRLLFSASALNAIFRLFKKSIETSRRSSLVRDSCCGGWTRNSRSG